jgi:hypothetical protein
LAVRTDVREVETGLGAGAGVPQVITTLLSVDLARGVATYVISKPSVYTTYTTVTRYQTLTLRTIYSVVTNIIRTYLLPDGKVYTILRIPTRLTLSSTVMTVTGATKGPEVQPVPAPGGATAVR